MDLGFFLKKRTQFIRYFYDAAVRPFTSIAQAIENEEEPYEPVYSEDGELQFELEWRDAQTGIQTVGHTAVSMLASSLKLFLNEWSQRFERDHGMNFRDITAKHGLIHRYRKIFEDIGLVVDECPADLVLIEQVLLARNDVQHPEEITNFGVKHSKKNLHKFPGAYFASDAELSAYDSRDQSLAYWTPLPAVVVTREKLYEALVHVDRLCEWLESKYWAK